MRQALGEQALLLALRSEASTRYEKRLDPALPPLAAARFVEILQETCPSLTVAARSDSGWEPELRKVQLTHADFFRVLGMEIEQPRIIQILTRLGFDVSVSEDGLTIGVPSFRAGRDVSIPEDIIEEVGRIVGYGSVPITLPEFSLEMPTQPASHIATRALQNGLLAAGFTETCTISLLDAATLAKVGIQPEACQALQNPPSDDFKYLRPSLLVSLLAAAQRNRSHADAFWLGEVSVAFQKKEGEKPDEILLCSGLLVGTAKGAAFASAKAALPALLAPLRLAGKLSFGAPQKSQSAAHPGRYATVLLGGKKVGQVAQLHPAVAANFDLPEDTSWLCLDVADLLNQPAPVPRASSLPAFPPALRDLSFAVPTQLLAGGLLAAAIAVDERVSATLFDDFTNKEGGRSLALRVAVQDTSKTLQDAEVDALVQKIVTAAKEAGAELRGY